MRTACANVSWRNVRTVRRPKPDNWRSRSRNLFRFMPRAEFACNVIHRIASAKMSIRKELNKPQRLKLLMNRNNHQPRVPTLKDLSGSQAVFITMGRAPGRDCEILD